MHCLLESSVFYKNSVVTMVDPYTEWNVHKLILNQTSLLTIERHFDAESSVYFWLKRNWTLSIWFSIVYIILIFTGQYYLRTRPAYKLHAVLILWNITLVLFSIIGSVRICSEIYYVLKYHGWEYSVCYLPNYNGPTGLWTLLFVLSKAYELGDTFFIVVRKKRLIFLHWYHHVTVLIYTWFTCVDSVGSTRWFIGMNFTVHSLMYLYYAFRAVKISVPKPISIVITLLQISQMVVGLVVNITAYMVKKRGDFCRTNNRNLILAIAMYASYFLLFLHFFYSNYILVRGKRQHKNSQTKKFE